MRALLAALLLFAAADADAVGQARCGSSERFGNSVVRVGDSERRVIEAAGRPDMERQLENRQGGAAGIRMDYYRRSQTIQIYIERGVVVDICRVRN